MPARRGISSDRTRLCRRTDRVWRGSHARSPPPAFHSARRNISTRARRKAPLPSAFSRLHPRPLAFLPRREASECYRCYQVHRIHLIRPIRLYQLRCQIREYHHLRRRLLQRTAQALNRSIYPRSHRRQLPRSELLRLPARLHRHIPVPLRLFPALQELPPSLRLLALQKKFRPQALRTYSTLRKIFRLRILLPPRLRQILCQSAPHRRIRRILQFLVLWQPQPRPTESRVPARRQSLDPNPPDLSVLRFHADCIRVQTPTAYHRQSICLHSIGCLSEVRCRPRRQVPRNRYPYSPTNRLCRSATRSCPARRGCFQAPPPRGELCQVKSCSAYRKICFPLISPQLYILNRIKVSFCVSPLRT